MWISQTSGDEFGECSGGGSKDKANGVLQTSAGLWVERVSDTPLPFVLTNLFKPLVQSPDYHRFEGAVVGRRHPPPERLETLKWTRKAISSKFEFMILVMKI